MFEKFGVAAMRQTLKFEDTRRGDKPRGFAEAIRLGGNRIQLFDKQVERASREIDVRVQVRAISQNRIDAHSSGVGQVSLTPSRDDQVSNESLILAQNQRWRRA